MLFTTQTTELHFAGFQRGFANLVSGVRQIYHGGEILKRLFLGKCTRVIFIHEL